MTDSTRAERQLARLSRVRDEELTGIASGPAARTLLAALLTEQARPERPAPSSDRPARPVPSSGGSARPVPSSGRPERQVPGSRWRGRPIRRWGLATAALVAVTAAVVLGPSLLSDGTGTATSYANSAIEIRQEGEFFVARIKDPLADRARYVEAFRAVGKDVEIELVPVSPRLVGVRIQAGGDGSGQVRASSEMVGTGPTPVDCAVVPASCTLVIRISTDTTGLVRYKVGRAALPGEAYQDPVSTPGVPPAPGTGGDGGTGD